MVRKTGRKGTATRKAKSRIKPKETKSDYKSSLGEFNFQFEDEQLQKRFQSAWEEYNKVLPKFPMPKSVGYIEAKSLVSGKNKNKLDKIKDVYSRDDDLKGDVESLHHKNTVLDDISKSITQKSINNYITQIQKKFKRIEQSRPHKTSSFNIYSNPQDVRYNYVYYADHGKTKQS